MIASYEVLEELGHGSMSQLFKVYHSDSNSFFALKLLSPCLSSQTEFVSQFHADTQKLSRIKHAQIPGIIEYGIHHEQLFYVTPYQANKNLRSYIKKHTPPSLDKALKLFKSIAGALSHAHEQKLIHGKLKPENIFLDSSFEPIINDFAFSKRITLCKILNGTYADFDLTSDLCYMAPEQFYPLAGEVQESTDIYSLGLIFFEILTGNLPYPPFKTIIECAHFHITHPAKSILDYQADLPASLDACLQKMLEKNPCNRIQNASELLFQLKTINSHSMPHIEILSKDHSLVKSINEFNESFASHKNKENPVELAPDHGPIEGKVLKDRYRIEKLISKPILSNLFLGYDLQKDMHISIQVPSENHQAFRLKLKEEFDIIKSLDHPGLIKIMDIIEHNGRIYLIREFNLGRPIKNILQSGKVSIEKALRIILGLLDTLCYLHALGMVQRDINNEIITVNAESEVKIYNLLISKAKEASSVSSLGFMGLVAYAPPEKISQSRYDYRSDIYSTGILLFELLTGKTPFASDKPAEILEMHLNKEAQFSLEDKALIPLPLQEIVLKALAKKPYERYQTAREFYEEIKLMLESYTQALKELDQSKKGKKNISQLLEKKVQEKKKQKNQEDGPLIKNSKGKLQMSKFYKVLPLPKASEIDKLIYEHPHPDYIHWLLCMLDFIECKKPVTLAKSSSFEFHILKSPEYLDELLLERVDQGHSARLCAGLCWPWTKELDQNMTLAQDISIDNFTKAWVPFPSIDQLPKNVPSASYWSVVPQGINQVGNVYTLQDLKFDYIGVIFGKDLSYNDEESSWLSNPQACTDEVLHASRKPLQAHLLNHYRILLSRGIKGVYVFFMDHSTEAYFRNHIEK
jgi:serine/threonine protein kinase